MSVMNVRGIYFPYCLQRLDDKSWVVLNRNYNPLGLSSTSQVVQDTDPALRIARITPAQMQELSCTGQIEDEGSIYLYNDGCIPTTSQEHTKSYMKRLAILMQLKLRVER